MELLDLKHKICQSFKGSNDRLRQILKLADEDQSAFPFNQHEYAISHMIEAKGLTFEEYTELRTEYINKNPNLWIFEISAPRDFGEKFAQTYISGKCIKLKRPSKKLDPNYSGQYDMWMNGIKIEVKASRAVDRESNDPLYIKALSKNTRRPFLMNFQQLKPQCCDIFIWVAVFRDEIVLWVIPSKDVLANPLFSKGQHRGNYGNEGQMHIEHSNIHMLNDYELGERNLERLIRKMAKNKT